MRALPCGGRHCGSSHRPAHHRDDRRLGLRCASPIGGPDRRSLRWRAKRVSPATDDPAVAITRRYAEARHRAGLAAPADALPLLARAAPALAALPAGVLRTAAYSRWPLDARSRQNGYRSDSAAGAPVGECGSHDIAGDQRLRHSPARCAGNRARNDGDGAAHAHSRSARVRARMGPLVVARTPARHHRRCRGPARRGVGRGLAADAGRHVACTTGIAARPRGAGGCPRAGGGNRRLAAGYAGPNRQSERQATHAWRSNVSWASAG